MKLAEHVEELRNLIDSAYQKQFSGLGIGQNRLMDLEKIPEDRHEQRRHLEEMLESHIQETGSYQEGRDKLIDELTFTLFNRIAAVKVMEGAKLFPPIITRETKHGGRSFGHTAWLETHPDLRREELDGLKDYIQYAFNDLGDTLPLYSKRYPYDLLPDVITLNEIIDVFNSVEDDPDVEDDLWRSDDVLGWLYESYNNAKKEAFKDSGKKTEYDKVYLQSQVYTPRWVVKFLVDNSLGKLYLEMYPDSKIKNDYKIANAPETRERDPKPLTEVKLIDPACGSGNFLLYAFELLYDLYLDQIENYGADYREEDLPRLIVENNLHGIDIDNRATQLAQLGLYIKARKRKRDIGQMEYLVVSSDFYLPDYGQVRHIFEDGSELDKQQKALISEVWGDLQNAYKFGSLIRVDEKIKAKLNQLIQKRIHLDSQERLFSEAELGIKPQLVQQDLFLEHDIKRQERFAELFFNNLKAAVSRFSRAKSNSFLASQTANAIVFLELVINEYDLAITNPPYTDSADFGPELKIFVDNNFKTPYKFHTNLYSAFIKRCFELTISTGYVSMIHPRTFMFIKSFMDVRKFILTKSFINVFVDYSLSNLFGAIMVDPAFYVLKKGDNQTGKSYFIALDQYTRTPKEKYKKEFCLQALDDYILGHPNKNYYLISQEKLKLIKTWPFIFWISDEFRNKFKAKALGDISNVVTGLMTGNNKKFLRYFWEVDKEKLSDFHPYDKRKWVGYQKGGPYTKWYGNNWTVVNYDNQGSALATTDNKEFYFNQGITYSASGSKGVSFRFIEPKYIFDKGGPCIFTNQDEITDYYLLGLLNSKLSSYIINCLNPTVNRQVGDIKRIPLPLPNQKIRNIVDELVEINVGVKNNLCEYSFIERDFIESPLSIFNDNDLVSRIKSYLDYENVLLTQTIIIEAIINRNIFKVYGVNDQDKDIVINLEGEIIGDFPVCNNAREAFLNEININNELRDDKIEDYVKLLPEASYEVNEINKIKKSFKNLYQKNNDLEEFCKSNQVNPINVWYWFKESNTIPIQRMNTLTMEFLADQIREILLIDDDGIIPLADHTGNIALVKRIEEKLYQKGFSTAQFSQLDTILQKPLGEYLTDNFFIDLSNRLNLFMYFPKAPFIWHIKSGSEHGFECYLIIYKWSRDKLMRLRSVYVEQRESGLRNRQSDLNGNTSAEAQNERDKIFKQLKEIYEFKQKIDDLLAEGYDPVLDDGVGKNIAPLQAKGMLAYDVLTDSQLKTYLNADW